MSTSPTDTITATPEIPVVHCPKCHADVTLAESWQNLKVCPECGHHAQFGAMARIQSLLDPGSFDETNSRLVSVDPLGFSDLQPYRERVMAAREKTGLNEGVVTGRGTIQGHEVVLAVVDFAFLGGSMGSVVGEKLTQAFELATERHVPLITVVASGGARMQEGMLSLVQMAKTTAAAQRLHDARVPYISVLTSPTTGGMYASFASQGDITIAEPKALIGFAGPRVIQGVTGDNEGALRSHSAEFLFERGFIDLIVERPRLRNTLATLLRLLTSRERRLTAAVAPQQTRDLSGDVAWDVVQDARHPDRPTSLDYIRSISPQFFELHGDRVFGDDPAVVAGIGELAGNGVIFIGQERGHGDPRRRGGKALPEGYRKALRMMQLAERTGLPLITLIDTPGASLGIEAEERGLSVALSECLATMSRLPVPIVAAVIGEGGSGGALALGVADRVLMQEHAIYSVIAPEGAAAILYRDVSRAPDVAEALKITASDCLRLGVADRLVAEPDGGAHGDPELAAAYLRDALVTALAEIQGTNSRKLVADRYRKFRHMGEVNSYWREFVAREASELTGLVARTVGALRPRRGSSGNATGNSDLPADAGESSDATTTATTLIQAAAASPAASDVTPASETAPVAGAPRS